MNEIYRDPTEGAAARRHDLLGRRRDELVTMPHAIRRVVVARWGRIAASLAAWLGAEAMVIAAVSPSIAQRVAHVLPGKEPAPLSTLLIAAWVLGLVAYWIARSAAEHRFAVAMTRTVLPGEDVFHDLERLDHVHPDEVARSMAHRLEVLSAALPVAAAATILPATFAYLAMGVSHGGWPSERMYEDWVALHAGALAWTALGGLGASMIMTRRAARLPGMALFAAVAGVAATGFMAMSMAWWLVGPAAIAVTIAFVVRRLRIERERIQAEDPAAGSEVFTLRGFIRQTRTTLASARAFVQAHRRGAAITIAALAGTALIWSARSTRGDVAVEAKAPAPAIDFGKVTPAAQPGSRSTYVLDKGACEGIPFAHTNCLRLAIHFRDRRAIDLPSVFPELDGVPAGWHADLAVRLVTNTTATAAVVDAFGDQHRLDEHHSIASFTALDCVPGHVATSVRVEPDPQGGPDQDVLIWLAPSLELGPPCLAQTPAAPALP